MIKALFMSDRDEKLNQLLKGLYECISFPDGGEPGWDRMNAIFHPEARLTRITPEGIEHFDLQTFKAMALEMLNIGVYTSFCESETTRRQHIFGSLAHVLSAYEIKGSIDARACLARGVNSIQLLWSGSAWQVLSLFWDEETDSNRLDVARLFVLENAYG
jgi:hypothetical protein